MIFLTKINFYTVIFQWLKNMKIDIDFIIEVINKTYFWILPLMMLKWKSRSIITEFYKSILTIMLTRQIFFNDVRIANNYSKIQCILAGHSCISSQYTIFVVSFRDILIFKPMALYVIFLCCLLSNLRTEHFIEGSPHIRMNLLIKTNGHRCCSVL